MIFTSPEEVIALTPQWKGERFADGRPKVADRYLDALRSMTLEELIAKLEREINERI